MCLVQISVEQGSLFGFLSFWLFLWVNSNFQEFFWCHRFCRLVAGWQYSEELVAAAHCHRHCHRCLRRDRTLLRFFPPPHHFTPQHFDSCCFVGRWPKRLKGMCPVSVRLIKNLNQWYFSVDIEASYKGSVAHWAVNWQKPGSYEVRTGDWIHCSSRRRWSSKWWASGDTQALCLESSKLEA